MKTMKLDSGSDTEVKRFPDEEAYGMTKKGWKYCPKSEWKATRKTSPKNTVKSKVSRDDEYIPDKKKNKDKKRSSDYKTNKHQG